MSRKRNIAAAVLITFVLTALLTFGAVRLYDSGILSYIGLPAPDNNIQTIKRAEELIDKMYYSEVDKDKLYEGALKGMMESLGDEYLSLIHI